MATQKTVFVVGAGASYEFDLPIGNTLKAQIADTLNFRFNGGHLDQGDGYIYETLQIYKHHVNREADLNRLINAARRISAAMVLAPSIDNFIHVHNGNREVEFCGKLAIAHRILRAECNSKLYVNPRDAGAPNLAKVEATWAVALMKLLGEDCTIADLPERLASVQFIVFNYDRCIEHFLYHAIQIYYGVNPEVAADLVNAVAIYHPYGVVGVLPWQTNREDRQMIGFGADANNLELIKIASSIKTFTEGTDDDSSDIIAIRRAMDEAHRIVFLGFAYHRLNVELMLGTATGTLSKNQTRRAFGTAFGMSSSDTGSVLDSLSQRLHAPSMAVRNDVKCVDLFYEYSRDLAFV